MPVDLVVARVLHVFAAAVWVGGVVFIAAVAAPYARSLPAEQRAAAIGDMGRRFRPVGWGALATLVGSGVYTMMRLGMFSGEFLSGTGYGRTLVVKLTLVTAVLVLAALHDFVLGPRSERGKAARSTVVVLARINGGLTAAVLVIGVVLAH